MTAFNWKITELRVDDGLVCQVKYFCEASNNGKTVATEGYWKFRKPYQIEDNLSEHQVSHWLDLDAQEGDRHLIRDRLAEQLEALDNTQSSDPPWKVETFKVKL
jgi:hypothetical protein